MRREATVNADDAIVVEGLHKKYGDKQALDGPRPERSPRGTVHGAARARTAPARPPPVRILATLLRPDAGRAEVAGHDVTREPARCGVASGCSASTRRSTRS